ncbi:NUDIX domain-containing protein [Williamsia sp. CHRR-6]|uniref:NUDIX hydrolase n=1 Tax=Williamsia sp. CHRR-6 TaxID=2835871 RepID=UPI001BD9A095|nr:NUDIX domain-containing protein [Williamsia sp. CHRR-6]MBT0565550.1 NUDIX domain-containing protein [Williamsia sp. CHRR-6]
MPTPDFILELRATIGHAPLWLSGVTAVVEHDNRVLLVRRADNGEWTPVTGIIDPGEQPADAAVRETAEETGVRAVPVRLAGVGVTPVVTYDNGDVTQYLDLTFRMRWLAGDPVVGDDENTECRWFPIETLPPMSAHMRDRIDTALSDDPAAHFTVTRR